MKRRFLKPAVNLITALIPVRKWRRAVRDRLTWRLELLLEGRAWDRLKHEIGISKKPFSVLVVGHDLSVTGAPMALLMEVKVLLKNGASVLAAAGVGGGLENELKKLGAPVLVSPAFLHHGPSLRRLARGFDLVVLNSLLCGNWVTALPDHLPLMWYIHEGAGLAGHLQARPELGRALAQARTIYVVSEHAASFLPDGVRAEVLHLGVPEVRVERPAEVAGGRLRLATVGTVMPNKGQHLVLEALAGLDENRLAELEVHFIGEGRSGEYYERLQALVRPGWPVTFEGEISDQDRKWEVYNSFDLFCVPSLDETCSLVLLEACMLGKPFIISDRVGGRYMLEEGANGLMFPAGDAAGLGRCLRWVLDHRGELSEMGRRARRAHAAKSSWDRFEENFLAAVRSLTTRPGRIR